MIDYTSILLTLHFQTSFSVYGLYVACFQVFQTTVLRDLVQNMRSEIILFFFGLLLVLCTPSQFVPSDDFGRNGPGDHDDNITVTSTTMSSVDLEIRFSGKNSDGTLTMVNTIIKYRSKLPNIPALSALRWNSTAGFYAANKTVLQKDSGETTIAWYRDAEPIQSESMTVEDLKLPGVLYEFEIENRIKGNTVNSFRTVARTRSRIPDAPKTGAGCFYVHRVTPEEKSRLVEVYWRPEQADVSYDVLVYEDTEVRSRFVRRALGFLDSGALWMNISMESHRFIFRSTNEAGPSSSNSIVYVPAQKNILPALSANVRKREEKGTFLLTWESLPLEMNVSNYTIFWLDWYRYDVDRTGFARVLDFVHVPWHQDSLEIKADNWLVLGISINNEKASSGLTVAHHNV